MALTAQIAKTYEHIQAVPAATWVITHGLGIYPIVDIYVDYEGEKHKILPLEVTHTDANTCTVTFSIPRSGLATVV